MSKLCWESWLWFSANQLRQSLFSRSEFRICMLNIYVLCSCQSYVGRVSHIPQPISLDDPCLNEVSLMFFPCDLTPCTKIYQFWLVCKLLYTDSLPFYFSRNFFVIDKQNKTLNEQVRINSSSCRIITVVDPGGKKHYNLLRLPSACIFSSPHFCSNEMCPPWNLDPLLYKLIMASLLWIKYNNGGWLVVTN